MHVLVADPARRFIELIGSAIASGQAHIADHSGSVAGGGAKIDRLPVGHLLHELSVPSVVKKSVEQWPDLPPHVRKAVKSLLQGELEKLKDAKKNK